MVVDDSLESSVLQFQQLFLNPLRLQQTCLALTVGGLKVCDVLLRQLQDFSGCCLWLSATHRGLALKA